MSAVTDSPSSGQGFDEAAALASSALELARRHRVPPVPPAFEVWFAYAGGLHSDICTRIDRALDGPGGVDPALIHKLHDEFLSDEAVGAGVARIGDRMDSDLATVIDLIEDGMSASDTYAGTVRRVDDALARSVGEAELRRHLQALRQASRSHAERVGRFSDSVLALRAQFTSMQKELRELRQSVLIDHATQLPNRRRFDEALDAAMRQARRTRTGLAVMLADIDHFRAFNERWGKATGDQVIARFAEVLRRTMREGDLPARFGGDEFALILPATSLDAARALADAARDEFARLRLVRSDSRERVANLTASLAVTTPRPDETGARLMARLDDYLLRAKEAGRNQVWSAA